MLVLSSRRRAACWLQAFWEQQWINGAWAKLLGGETVDDDRLAALFALKGWPRQAAIGVIAFRLRDRECADPSRGGPDWKECATHPPGCQDGGCILFAKGSTRAAFVPLAREITVGELERRALDLRRRLWPSTASEVSTAIGGIASKASEIQATWARAWHILRWGEAALGDGCLTSVASLGLLGLVMEFVPESRLEEYAAMRLAPLREHDRIGGADLYNTLVAFMQCQCNGLIASQRLFIHYNTLRHRLQRIEELLGVDLDSLSTRINLWSSIVVEQLAPDPTRQA